MQLSNGRNFLWQFEKDVTCKVPDYVSKINYIDHNGVLRTISVDNSEFEVPNELTDTPNDIVFWAYDAHKIAHVASLCVKEGPAPDNFGDKLLARRLGEITKITTSADQIGMYALYHYQNLIHFSAPLATTIGYYSLAGITSLKSAFIPSATRIHDYAFSDDTYLETIDMHSVTSIGDYAFRNCRSLVSVDAPLLETIQREVFYGTALKSINAPNVRKIYQYGLTGCNDSKFNFPLLETVENGACGGWRNATELNCPSLTSIVGSGNFYSWYSLTSVKMPLVTVIPQGTFKSCTNLTELHFPKVTTISGSGAFGGCKCIEEITDKEFPALSETIRGFENCLGLKTINLSLVTKIGYESFSGCSNLSDINLDAVSIIDDTAFIKCTSISKVDSEMFPVLTSIGSRAFQYCSGIRTIDLPTVTTISDSFSYCDGLINAKLSSVENADSGIFASCYKLKKVVLSKATKLGYSTFNNCHSLTAVVLANPNGVCALNKNTFSNCYHMLGKTNSAYNPEGAQDGYVYVPKALITAYESDSVWSTMPIKFRAIEDYGEILDE